MEIWEEGLKLLVFGETRKSSESGRIREDSGRIGGTLGEKMWGEIDFSSGRTSGNQYLNKKGKVNTALWPLGRRRRRSRAA